MLDKIDRARKLVYSKGGKEAGRIVGVGKLCTLEGCRGWRLPVRWADGKLTWPCTRGMAVRAQDGQWQIALTA
jgi:hypothetical protein